LKQSLDYQGFACELINDDILHNSIDDYIKWKSNALKAK